MDNLKVIENLLRSYIEKNFVEGVEEPKVTMQSAFGGDIELNNADFMKLYAQAKTGGETFSEMILRLVKESDEKTSTVYNRANTDAIEVAGNIGIDTRRAVTVMEFTSCLERSDISQELLPPRP